MTCLTTDDIFDEVKSAFERRKFASGLLVAFVDFLTALSTPSLDLESFDDFLLVFEQQERTIRGSRANTLIIRTAAGKTLSIRPFYNKAERFFRAEHKRYEYPSCAPHATQAWSDYRHWLDVLVTCSTDDLLRLKRRVQEFVLGELESHEFDPSTSLIEPPLFRLILEGFDLDRQKYEPSGAALQGVVFGFLRADNPHLQMEVDKVHTGSKRLQRIGDVDGWDGGRLAITAEVKQYEVTENEVPDFAAFATAVSTRGAIGIVATLGFLQDSRALLSGLGLIPIDRNDMLRIISLWDSVKQRIAVTSVFYYVRHVEKNHSLINRFEDFIQQATLNWNKKAHRESLILPK